jgi:flagellar hook protein FlgE
MSFQQGLSGLNASSRDLEVIGNNVANANTYGAKASRAEFADMYANSMNGAGSNNVGIGVQVATIAQQFTQGNITTTDNPLDLAINGSGFFQVSNGAGPNMYTRNGQFKQDRNGYLVNDQQHQLLGYPADSTGTIIPGKATPIQLPTGGISPRATDAANIEATLDSRVAATASTTPIDFTDGTTYYKATPQTVYDSKGQDVALTYYFRKTATDQWDVYATANGTTVATDASGNPAPITSITFPSAGGVPTSPTAPVSFDVPSVTLTQGGLSEPITGIQLDLTKTTEYGAPFAVTNLTQSGYAAGQLSSIQVDSSGIIMARYSNGQSKPAGQIELASFHNNQGLQPLGGNEWAQTYASGDPIVSTPGVGNFGLLQSGALEASNVDLTGELVNMIVAQRAYQANAQTIKTQDSVLQTLVNLR